MTTETTTTNLSALPYKIVVTRPEYHVMPVDPLHKMMCDLTKKIPNIRFETNGIQRWPHTSTDTNKGKGDDYNVYVGTEKVGNIWMSLEHRHGENIHTYVLSSARITNGRKGNRNTKRTKHYKVALREAAQAFAPYELMELASKTISAADDVVTRIASRAQQQLTWALNNAQIDLAKYAADVIDNGPHAIPDLILTKLPHGWRDKLNNYNVAENVKDSCRRLDGMALKLMPSGEFLAVTMRDKDVVAQSSNPYDLPSEYQDKFAILKMMEKDQPIANVGVKGEMDGGMVFYMAGGDLMGQGTPTT